MQDDIESRQRREEILSNRIERLRKQKRSRELDTVRFIRSMQMLQCGTNPNLSSNVQPSYKIEEDTGLQEYRKHTVQTMQEKAKILEMKLYFPVRVFSLKKIKTNYVCFVSTNIYLYYCL